MASAAEQLAANMNIGAFQKATELHKRIWFTLLAMVVYRLGTYIPIPGINAAAFAHAFEGQSKGILGMFNMFSGGAVQRMAVFSLNVMPYISSSIIVQLLQTTYPPWEKLRKEGGEAGRKQLNQYTRYPHRPARDLPVVRHRRRPVQQPRHRRSSGHLLQSSRPWSA